jgi:hypothetical protein
MSNQSFRDAWQPQPVVPAQLAVPVRRKAAPLAAWFMLTAIMAGQCAVLAAALSGRDWDQDLPELLGSMLAGGVLGAVLGGLSGLFDQSPLRGGMLGTLMGGLVGVTAVCAAMISPDNINLAFHTSALVALCVFASALMGRWKR